jgi:ABC-type multidrug transport system ATPase subunit
LTFVPDSLTSLELRNVAVSAGGKTLLRGLDLTISAGEVVGLSGPSGSGKTTLLRAISGLIDVSRGDVQLGGRTPAQIGWPAYRRKVVYVSQQPVLLDGTVADNLRRPFTYASAKRAFPESIAARLMERLGVGPERMDQEARTLSVGQQLRICAIRAMLVGPRFLLLDEPTSALDDEAAQQLAEVIEDLSREKSVGVLMITHDQARAEQWCDRSVDLRPYLSPVGEGDDG